MSEKNAFKERAGQLKKLFLQQLPERLATAKRMIDFSRSCEPSSRETLRINLETLHRIFHNLKGTSASLGFAAISNLAREAEDICLAAQGQSDLEAFIQQLPRLQDVIERMEALDPAQAPAKSMGLDLHRWSAQTPESGNKDKNIYICDDDPLQLAQVVEQLSCFGYSVRSFEHINDLVAAMRKQPPSVLIMDVVFPEGSMAGIQAVNDVKREINKDIPTVFISGQDRFDARLGAVRVGGLAYCIKPIAIMDLVEFLDDLCGTNQPEPYRILVVDDDPAIANYHALVLEQASMQVRVETDPTRVLEVLGEFTPDLVLMDLYMPICTGLELARILRQIPGHLGLPIVYLSSETEGARQFAALKAGADGFLTKPIEPQVLIAEVSLRAERMRTLRELMVRDSLTGLYNHNNIKRILDQELIAAQRRRAPLTLAMLDIDHFKQVNDVFGHAMGDQVLTALARLLRQRLRQSDFVGRYGGEEFAVILPDTDENAAKCLLDELRKGFANLHFLSRSTEFSVTFSGGIASNQQYPSAADLRMGADLALYKAKHSGRNRIEVAEFKPQ